MYSVTNPANKTFQTGAGALQTTPNSGTNGGTGTVPYQEINTLGNIIAACVNTTGSYLGQLPHALPQRNQRRRKLLNYLRD